MKYNYHKKYSRYYNSDTHKQWRDAIRARDIICQHCKDKGLIVQGVETHHIKPIETHPELASDVNNGILLCQSCHDIKHPKRCSPLVRFMEGRI